MTPPLRARGFSIVELAIVLMVFGLAMVMTLKGQVLIEIARAFAAAYDIQYFQSRMQLYTAQYHYLPGDDPKAASRFGHAEASRAEFGATVSSVGDNRIDGKFMDVDNPDGEQFMFWRDMRYARLLEGSPSLTGIASMPRSPFPGGVYGVDEGNLGQKSGSLCLNKVPGGAVQRIIDNLDSESIADQGQVVATARPDTGAAQGHYDAPDPPPYDPGKQYIVCAPLPP